MMTCRISKYLDFIVPRLLRLMSDYAAHRAGMMSGEVSGDAAIWVAIDLAGQIEHLLGEVAWYVGQGYETTDPLPVDVLEQLEVRHLV